MTSLNKATHSASELDSVTLFQAFDCQETGTPKTYRKKTLSLLILTRSLAQLLSLKQTNSHSMLAFLIGFKFKPKFLVAKTYLITHSNSSKARGLHLCWLSIDHWLCWQYMVLSALSGTITYLLPTNFPFDLPQGSSHFQPQAYQLRIQVYLAFQDIKCF